ncbi:MAG: type I-D CRISPR-associated helicase Cas3' [Cyanobacteria bacterium P01_F01_bin.150]
MTHERLSLLLEAQSIAACAEIPSELAFMGQALQHQVDVFEKSRNHDIVLDLSPTGTGKTKAAFTVLLHESNRNQNAIYIAPTNALVEQQKQAAEEFIKKAGLPHFVISASAKEVRAWPDQVGKRSGEKIYNLLRNPATVFPEVGGKRPVLLVTNPDIFYYATFFAYQRLDKVNIASQFYQSLVTVVFDEFHLYSAKQLVGLLFYLALSHEFGFFKHGRRVILLTATPEPECDAALSKLQSKGVRVAFIDDEDEASVSRLLPSQTAVDLELRPLPDRDSFLSELGNEVAEQYQSHKERYGAVILDSLEQINRLSDLLQKKGLSEQVGRITGPSPLIDRQQAIQCPIILATSTVDVGFNFERNPAPQRQTLDWLIFSARDRSSFWQRIGRVGRVLGRQQTDIRSEAIAYLSEKAWEEGLDSIDTSGGRVALQQKLLELPCLDRPFLSIYWQSEAFLEIARPLLKLEEMMEGLSQSDLISKLYNTLKTVLGGKRDWTYYRKRMQALDAAGKIANALEKDLAGDPLKFIKGKARWEIVTTFLKAECPDDWEDLKAKRTTFQQYEEVFKEDSEAADALKTFCKYFSTSYAPLFNFRSSLFKNLIIKDPKGLMLDISHETFINPIHLLRYYEFGSDGQEIELLERSKEPYQVNFRLRYRNDLLEFKATQMNKLRAFKECKIERKQNASFAPTSLISELEKDFIPGVIMCQITNAPAYYQLLREKIPAYPITVSGNNFEKEYIFLPGLAGIFTIALCGVKLRLPDNEEFLIF